MQTETEESGLGRLKVTRTDDDFTLQVMLNVVGVIPGKEKVLIVDPFCGTGTTLVAAHKLGYAYIGFDINENYIHIAEDRLKTEAVAKSYKQLKLF